MFCIPDGVDFISSIAVSDTLAFPFHSGPSDTHCIIINLLNDTFYESNDSEDFIIELSTQDPSVIISEDANLAVVIIRDIPHPLGKLMKYLESFLTENSLCQVTLLFTAVAVSFVLRDYSDTEGINLFVEVCVHIVFGTLSEAASVNLWTVSQSATGEYSYSIDIY